MNQLKQICVLLMLLSFVKSDLPVHCMKHQIVGEWKIYIQKPDLQGPGPVACGHSVPDNEQTSYKAGWSDFKKSQEFNVYLADSNLVHENKKQNLKKGKWTMIYDEGFEFIFKGIKYFAFSKYDRADNGGWSSFCGETLIGWYHNTDTDERGCFYGIKKNHKQVATEQAHNAHVVQPKLLELNDNQNTQDKSNIIMTQQFQEEIVQQIKQTQPLWTPKIYSQWEGMTFNELNKRGGNIRQQQTLPVNQNSLIEEHGQEQMHIQGQLQYEDDNFFRNFSLDDISDLPKEFTWEKYLGRIYSQKECGSCYTISTMSMLSARLRMQGDDVELSPQHSIDCNYFNQGCNGGYPFLVAKFASEQYLVSEQSYPYTGYTGKCRSQEVLSKEDTVYGVSDYSYIGGAMGQSSERKMMEEILANGPIVVNFEPQFDFMFYGGGIYHSAYAADWILNSDERPQWEKVDHSVLCYGWGEENGQKYWLLQNSWGETWGEKGRFRPIFFLNRMRRGTDESAIESMSETATVFKKSNKIVNSKIFLQKQSQQRP